MKPIEVGGRLMINKRVEQIRTDALVAKSIYAKRLRVANAFKVAINILIIITPIFFIAAKYLTKSSAFASFADTVAFIGSVLLLCLAIYVHKSGGPRMTVYEIEDDIIYCEWLDNYKKYQEHFAKDCLKM